MKIAVDFDGTIVEHEYPIVGKPVPGAIETLKKFQELGCKIILFTMRSGRELQQAVEYCEAVGIKLYGINSDPDQKGWTSSPKAYANCYVDDAAIGCPLLESKCMGARPYVDWPNVAILLMEKYEEYMQQHFDQEATDED